MPKITRFFVKTSLIYFVFSLFLGLAMAGGTFLPLPSFLTSILPTYLHTFMVGWITQMIFGVSIWMFPSPDSGGRYGKASVTWSIYWTLNVGLILRIIGEPGQHVFQQTVLMNWFLVLSGLFQWVSSLLYVYHIWGRVKGQ